MFYPDGAEIELTPNYHELSASSIVAVYQFAQLNGYQLPSDFVARLEKIYEVFVKLRMPDGRMPAINDSDWIHTTASLRTASSLFPDRMDFKYFITDGKEGKEPNYTSVWMPWAGWYVMRSGWGKDAFILFEVGPLGLLISMKINCLSSYMHLGKDLSLKPAIMHMIHQNGAIIHSRHGDTMWHALMETTRIVC